MTKIELARYIADVGPWMINHIEGRPCSVIRAPDGIEGQQFFQRHAGPGTPDTVEQVRVSGDRKPYLEIDTVEGLVAMAQMAALEFHPWNSLRAMRRCRDGWCSISIRGRMSRFQRP